MNTRRIRPASGGPIATSRNVRFFPIGNKLIAAATAVVSLATALIFIGALRYEREKIIVAKEQAARKAGELFLRYAATPVMFDDTTGIQDTVALLAQDPDILGVELWRARKATQNGQDGKPGGPGERLASLFRPGAESVPALAEVATAPGTIERRPDRLILRDVVLDRNHRVIALVTVQSSLLRENRAYQALRLHVVLGACAIALLLSGVLGGLTRHWISGPLRRLLEAARRLEAGEREDQTAPGAPPGDAGTGEAAGNDEVGRLAAAFSRMAQAVLRREADILRRSADMKRIMDHVAQGFLTLTRDGRLLPEHSAILETWFGPWPDDRFGPCFFWEYVAADMPRHRLALELLWDNVSADILPLDAALMQLPERISNGERTFALDFRIIASDDGGCGEIDAAADSTDPAGDARILLMVSDVTLEIAKDEQQEMVVLCQWLASDRDGLRAFFDNAEQLVHRVASATDNGDPQGLCRDLHTLKGNCGLYGQSGLAQACQEIEDHLAEGVGAVPGALGAEDREALLSAGRKLAERRRLLLGDIDKGEITLSPGEHRELMLAIETGVPRHELLLRVRALLWQPAEKPLMRLAEQARALGRRLGKGEIEVQVSSDELRLPEQVFADFWSSFAHLLRNALDHGLESPDERQRAGKPRAGRLTLRATVRDGRLVIELTDDGRGIDWDKLRDKARQRGLPADTQDDLTAALFADGVSTRDAVTAMSGRGVGLSAVRAACEDSGGKVRVQSEPGVGTCFQFSWAESVLLPAPRREPARIVSAPPGPGPASPAQA